MNTLEILLLILLIIFVGLLGYGIHNQINIFNSEYNAKCMYNNEVIYEGRITHLLIDEEISFLDVNTGESYHLISGQCKFKK